MPPRLQLHAAAPISGILTEWRTALLCRARLLLLPRRPHRSGMVSDRPSGHRSAASPDRHDDFDGQATDRDRIDQYGESVTTTCRNRLTKAEAEVLFDSEEAAQQPALFTPFQPTPALLRRPTLRRHGTDDGSGSVQARRSRELCSRLPDCRPQ